MDVLVYQNDESLLRPGNGHPLDTLYAEDGSGPHTETTVQTEVESWDIQKEQNEIPLVSTELSAGKELSELIKE